MQASDKSPIYILLLFNDRVVNLLHFECDSKSFHEHFFQPLIITADKHSLLFTAR